MTPVDVSATERAAPLTDTLPVRRPVEESISNRPRLDLPASIHMEPFACGCVAEMRLPGARRMRCGTMLTAVAPFVFGWLLPEQAARASAAAVSPMSAVVRRAALAISGFPSNSRDTGSRGRGFIEGQRWA